MPPFPRSQRLGAEAPLPLQLSVGFCSFKYHSPGERTVLPEHRWGEACSCSKLWSCLHLPQASNQCWQPCTWIRHRCWRWCGSVCPVAALGEELWAAFQVVPGTGLDVQKGIHCPVSNANHVQIAGGVVCMVCVWPGTPKETVFQKMSVCIWLFQRASPVEACILSSYLKLLMFKHCAPYGGAGYRQTLEERWREHISQGKERVTKSFLACRLFAFFLVFCYSSFPL